MDMKCNTYGTDKATDEPGGMPCAGTKNMENLFRQRNYLGRAFLRVCQRNIYFTKKASLTLEAAVVVPLFLLGICALFLVFDLFRVQALVKTSLNESAQELGMYAYAVEEGESAPVDVFSSLACAAYAKANLPDLGSWTTVSLVGTYVTDEKLYLVANVTYKIPMAVFPLPAIHVRNRSSVRMWTGNQGDNDAGQLSQGTVMVYVSDYESVYHTSASCTYLDITVHSCSQDDIGSIRNAYGSKYKVCEKCGNIQGNGTVYYTEKGDHYHLSESCSGLKRSVKLVPQSSVAHLRECTRCQGRAAA